jgi:hypothetical protein
MAKGSKTGKEAVMQKLVRAETPIEYFKELVESAIAKQGVTSSELSSYYLVQLLDQFVSADLLYAELAVDGDRPLAELLTEALSSRGERRFTRLKLTGDLALFISGFFSDSIARRRVDLDYYVQLGGYAYGGAARFSPQELSPVFDELASKFGRFVDVLNEVSETSSITENAGILRLYERWLATRSRRSEALLRQEGILLGPGSSRVH